VLAGQRDGAVDVFVEWSGEADPDRHPERDVTGCFELHRVRWQDSYIANSGSRICHFQAPDAESVRMALRRSGVISAAIWTGTVYGEKEAAITNVVVDSDLPSASPADAREVLEIARTEWLSPFRFKLVQAILSANRRRLICFCEASDSNAIRLAQSAGKSPGLEVWPCRRVSAPA
jgi:hypothetical protein